MEVIRGAEQHSAGGTGVLPPRPCHLGTSDLFRDSGLGLTTAKVLFSKQLPQHTYLPADTLRGL